MGTFYLDLEFTNGNYYLADILEIALLSEESGNLLHSYVKIHYSIPQLPQQVQQLTAITKIILSNLLDFHLEKLCEVWSVVCCA